MGNGIKSMAVRCFKPEDISKIFSAVDRSNSGDSGITDAELKYMEGLKQRYTENPQESDQGDKRELTYSKAVQGPPKKLLKKNLYYSQFNEPNVMRMNVAEATHLREKKTFKDHNKNDLSQEVASQLEKLSNRIEQLEHNDKLSQESQNVINDTDMRKSIRKVEVSFDEKLRRMNESFQKKLVDSDLNQKKLLQNSEDRLLKRIGEMQLEQVDKIQNSTLQHMDERFESMFKKICQRLQSQPESTNNGEMNNPVVGKS